MPLPIPGLNSAAAAKNNRFVKFLRNRWAERCSQTPIGAYLGILPRAGHGLPAGETCVNQRSQTLVGGLRQSICNVAWG
jgi:hypothetical protein